MPRWVFFDEKCAPMRPMKRRRREREAEGEPAKRPAAAEGRPPPLRAACRGEYVHPALRCAAVQRKGFGCVTSAKLRAGELLLVARGLRFSSASAEPGRRDGGLFLAEALQQLGALVHGDAADATALLGSWRGLCPREPSVALRAPLLAQTATLTELLALHGANCGVRGIGDLVDLVLKIECNAFAGGLFPLAACLNHSCRPNVAVTLRRAKSLGPGGEESETSTHETRALRDIGAGEELCIHYLGLAAQHRGRWERRHVLSNGPRGFICCCAGCASCAGDAAGSMRCTHGARDESDGDSTAAAAAAAVRPIEWLEMLANRERRDISSGWCTQTALDRWAACGRCCSKGRTCRPAATAADLRACERALQAAPSADDLHAPRWGVSLEPACLSPQLSRRLSAICNPTRYCNLAHLYFLLLHMCLAVARGGDEAGGGGHTPAPLAAIHIVGGAC